MGEFARQIELAKIVANITPGDNLLLYLNAGDMSIPENSANTQWRHFVATVAAEGPDSDHRFERSREVMSTKVMRVKVRRCTITRRFDLLKYVLKIVDTRAEYMCIEIMVIVSIPKPDIESRVMLYCLTFASSRVDIPAVIQVWPVSSELMRVEDMCSNIHLAWKERSCRVAGRTAFKKVMRAKIGDGMLANIMASKFYPYIKT